MARKIDNALGVDPTKTEETIRRMQERRRRAGMVEIDPKVRGKVHVEDVGWADSEDASPEAQSGRWNEVWREANDKSEIGWG